MRLAPLFLGLAPLAGFAPPTPLASAPSAEPIDEAAEYALKAAFLFNFTKYVTWPEEAFEDDEAPFVVAIVGEDPFEEILDDTMEDQKVGDHEIVVRRFEDPEDVDGAHILFVSESLEEEDLEDMYALTEEQYTLTVGDFPGFASSGGIIRLFIKDKKIRFEINIDAGERAGVKISSKLLDLATIVRDPDDSVEVP